MSIYATKCKMWHFLKITVFKSFIISPVIFGLQRRTLSQIKALKILLWPCFIIFSLTINICWPIMSRSCIGFFTQSIELRKRFSSDILILPWFDNFFSYFDKFLHFTQRYWCIWFHEKKEFVNLMPFYITEFSNSFCQRFFYPPFNRKNWFTVRIGSLYCFEKCPFLCWEVCK